MVHVVVADVDAVEVVACVRTCVPSCGCYTYMLNPIHPSVRPPIHPPLCHNPLQPTIAATSATISRRLVPGLNLQVRCSDTAAVRRLFA